jgi:hypothetical protein
MVSLQGDNARDADDHAFAFGTNRNRTEGMEMKTHGIVPDSVPASFSGGASIHAEIIAGILADHPNAKTKNFIQAVKAIEGAEYMEGLNDYFPEWWKSVAVIPDAYLIDMEKREVVVFEAVHRHDVDRDKFAKLAELAWALDEDRIDLVLMRCDRFSRTRYLPRHVSIVHRMENVVEMRGHDITVVNDWHRYTAEYCQGNVPASLL